MSASTTLCPNGHQNPDGVRVCATCGAPIEAAAAATAAPGARSPSHGFGTLDGAWSAGPGSSWSERAASPVATAVPPMPDAPATSRVSPAPTRKVRQLGPVLGVVGGGMILVGSFLPWATLDTPFGNAAFAGTLGGGRLTGVLAAGLIAVGVISLRTGRRLALPQIVAALAVGAVAGINLSHIASAAVGINTSSIASASVGAGLYLALGGAIAALIGGLAS